MIKVRTPAQYLANDDRSLPVVVCVGDSITQGSVSANWVNQLAERFPSYQFVNAGRNGELAWNVVQRLDEIIACRPSAVTVLLGTNDVQGTYSDATEASYRKQQHIPQTPTLEWYLENMQIILSRLTTETDARVAVLDIPPLGEDFDSVTNSRVNAYNAALRSLAAEHDTVVLPLHDTLVAMRPAGTTAPVYSASTGAIIAAALKHLILRQSWDRISRANGLAILTDHIHLNDSAAGELVSLAAPFLSREKRQQ